MMNRTTTAVCYGYDAIVATTTTQSTSHYLHVWFKETNGAIVESVLSDCTHRPEGKGVISDAVNPLHFQTAPIFDKIIHFLMA